MTKMGAVTGKWVWSGYPLNVLSDYLHLLLEESGLLSHSLYISLDPVCVCVCVACIHMYIDAHDNK